MQLHEGDTIKYEVSYRYGNEIKQEEFTSRESALEFANSTFVKTYARWVVLKTLERIK